MLKLLLIRHGQSEGNLVGRMEGISSTPLTALGEHQSHRLGQRLGAEEWRPTHVYCSPLRRATATLSAMVEGFNASLDTLDNGPPSFTRLSPLIELRDELQEYDHGIFNGLTWVEATERYPDLCASLEQSLDWRPIPQAETLEDGRRRSQRFVDYLLRCHQNGDRVWVVSHHWILQQIIARLLGCDRAWGLPMGNTARFEFWLDPSRWPDPGPNRLNTELWKIKRFNDCSHL
ncbi:MAG: histidine phosphatase family protein [Nodosilinea sp.]